MIITCPSCGTRYRQPAAAADSAADCCCSRCEAVFSSDIRAPKYSTRSSETAGVETGPVSMDAVLAVGARLEPLGTYIPGPVVLPVEGPIPGDPVLLADLPIGMDDPTLASKIKGHESERHLGTVPLSYSSVPAEEPQVVVEQPEPEQNDRQKDTRPGFGAWSPASPPPWRQAHGNCPSYLVKIR